MNYWLDLFTGTTWEEFQNAGSTISGFRKRVRNLAKKVKTGDVFLCYLTGVQHWVGALEVIGPTDDQTPIWKDETYPVRFQVKPLIQLDARYGVPMKDLKGQVDFYSDSKDKGKYKGFVRRSPNCFQNVHDGELVFHLLQEAKQNPKVKPVDPKQLAYKPKPLYKAELKKGKTKIPAVVSVPEPEDVQKENGKDGQINGEAAVNATKHTEIQYQLLSLGAEMGLDVWVAKNDKGKSWKGVILGEMPRIIPELPTQFNEATNRTIELIDVLWLKGNSIVAAFEVESTTAIYSGLLRMSDLLALQPNLDIKLYLLAPDERRNKVEQEILRPTFSLRERPLPKICGFLSFSSLTEKVQGIKKLGVASALKPEFLEQAAEYFGDEEGDE